MLRWLVQYTYPVVFIGMLVDASGLPFPGRLLMAAAGALAGDGQRSLLVIIALGVLAAVAMDTLWYLGGRWGSTRVLRLYRRFAGASAEGAAVDYFTRYGAATILLGRFFTSVRALAWPVAAAHGIGYVKFVLLDVLAATVWSSLWVGLGWWVGERWRVVTEEAGIWMTLAGVIVLALVGVPLALRWWRRRNRAIADKATGMA